MKDDPILKCETHNFCDYVTKGANLMQLKHFFRLSQIISYKQSPMLRQYNIDKERLRVKK